MSIITIYPCASKECSETGLDILVKQIIVHTNQGLVWPTSVEYCPNCKKYVGKTQMETNIKKVAAQEIKKLYPEIKQKDITQIEFYKQ